MTIVCNTFDKRIKDSCDILSFKKYDDKYVGKTGYFSDSMCRFQDLTTCVKSTLTGIDKNVEAGDYIFENEYGNFRYFLPESLVKPVEKKYRPYTLAEWIGQHTIGDVIRYRCKSQKIELRHLYAGYGYGIGADIKNTTSGTLTLGVASYSLDYLLEDYEIEVNGEWLPFGVIDEQGAGE